MKFPRGRLLSESIAFAAAHAKESGYEPTMDADFDSDLSEIINNRKLREVFACNSLDSVPTRRDS